MRVPRGAFGAGILVAGLDLPFGVERDRRDALDGLAGARQEHVEDRQRAADLAGAQVALHLLGDEEAEAQDRAQRVLDIVERRANDAARQFGQVGHLPRTAPARPARKWSPSDRRRWRRGSPAPRTCRTWSAWARRDGSPTRRGFSRAGAARAGRRRCRRICAWRCQDGSLVRGISGESAEGCMPARNFAVSSGGDFCGARRQGDSQNEGGGERGSFEAT